MRYTGFVCPVCECNFTETDDVVVCPDCGTPHHRRCWQQINMCANSDKHGDGFIWNGEKSATQESNNVIGKVCPRCGLLNAEDEPVCVRCGERLYQDGEQDNKYGNYDFDSKNPDFNMFPPFMNGEQNSGNKTYSYENPYAKKAKETYGDKTVDGIPVSEIAEYIQKNNEKYISEFVEAEDNNKKLTWNWASALFGGFWLFYRKITAAGIIFCILSLSLTTIGGILTEKFFKNNRADEYAEYIQAEEDFNDFAEKYSSGEAVTQEELTEITMNLLGCKLSLAQTSVKAAISVLSFCIMGFLGTPLYKKKVNRSIHKLRTVAVDDRTYHFVLRSNGGVSVINLLLPFVFNSLFEMILSIF